MSLAQWKNRPTHPHHGKEAETEIRLEPNNIHFPSLTQPIIIQKPYIYTHQPKQMDTVETTMYLVETPPESLLSCSKQKHKETGLRPYMHKMNLKRNWEGRRKNQYERKQECSRMSLSKKKWGGEPNKEGKKETRGKKHKGEEEK